MLADALEHLVRGLVTNPDDVAVSDLDHRRVRTLEVRVNPEDIGKVIGRQGRTASALRTVIGALAGREQVRVPCAFGPASYEATAVDYVHGYPIPTAYFHLNMLYAILRSRGVPLGKTDYMEPFMKSFQLQPKAE